MIPEQSVRPERAPDAEIGASAARVNFLDGIRGWASFAVLLAHSLIYFLALTTPALRFDHKRLAAGVANHDYLDIIAGTALRFVSNGHLAVLVFFVLSGYALSIGHLNLAKRKLAQATASRYFRLLIPVLFTSLVAYVLLKSGLMFNLEAAKSPDGSPSWIGSMYRFDAGLADVLRFSFFDVFFRYDPDATYNSSLWTMPVELAGSLLIYSYLAIFRATETIHWRLVALVTLALFLVIPVLACFMIGYSIAELGRKHTVESLCEHLGIRHPETILLSLFVISGVLATYFKDDNRLACVFASNMVFAVAYSKGLKSFFSNSASHFLGRISFPLYLIQIPIICSWSAYLYVRLPTLGLDASASNLINLFSTIFLCLLCAVLLLPVEKLSVSLSKKIGNALIS